MSLRLVISFVFITVLTQGALFVQNQHDYIIGDNYKVLSRCKRTGQIGRLIEKRGEEKGVLMFDGERHSFLLKSLERVTDESSGNNDATTDRPRRVVHRTRAMATTKEADLAMLLDLSLHIVALSRQIEATMDEVRSSRPRAPYKVSTENVKRIASLRRAMKELINNLP